MVIESQNGIGFPKQSVSVLNMLSINVGGNLLKTTFRFSTQTFLLRCIEHKQGQLVITVNN